MVEDQAGHVCILLLHPGGDTLHTSADTLHPGGNTLHPGADTLRSLRRRNVRRRFNCRESKSLQDFVDFSLTQTMPGNRKRATQHTPILSEQIQGKHKGHAAAEHGVQYSCRGRIGRTTYQGTDHHVGIDDGNTPLQAPSFPAPLPEEGEATIEQPSRRPAPLVIMAIHDLPRRHTVSPGPVAGGPERAAHPIAPRHRPPDPH